MCHFFHREFESVKKKTSTFLHLAKAHSDLLFFRAQKDLETYQKQDLKA